MKKTKIIYWTTTILLFLFEGVMPAFTSQTELAKEGIRNLGYPDYFGVILTVFKVCGSILLLIKITGPRLKEWVYAGFSFDFIFAGLSNAIVIGTFGSVLLPIVCLILLALSYFTYHALRKNGHWYKSKLSLT